MDWTSSVSHQPTKPLDRGISLFTSKAQYWVLLLEHLATTVQRIKTLLYFELRELFTIIDSTFSDQSSENPFAADPGASKHKFTLPYLVSAHRSRVSNSRSAW